MADRKTHEYDCLEHIGDKCTAVHKLIDRYFAQYFHRHRFKLHHWEGIKATAKMAEAYYNMDYDLAYEGGVYHVKLDFYTGYQLPIPKAEDYIGGEGDWPVGKDWNMMCPWSTLGCDKTFEIDAKTVEEIKKELYK